MKSPRRTAISIAFLTFLLGLTVAVSWIAFGGGAAFRGPDRVLRDAWPWIYGSQALMALILTALLIRFRDPRASFVAMTLLVIGAWLGELVALTLGGNLLANELDPPVAWVFWLMGTGGPVQLMAALAGGAIGLRWGHDVAEGQT